MRGDEYGHGAACGTDGDGRPMATRWAECGQCGTVWCPECDPAPAALCHVCHGRGYSVAVPARVRCECGAVRTVTGDCDGRGMPAHPDVRKWPRFAWCELGDVSAAVVAVEVGA